MKTEHLKKSKYKGNTVYTCPNCGGTMHYENNNAESSGFAYWYECTGCGTTATG